MSKSELHPTSKTSHGGAKPATTKGKRPAPGQTVILEATGLTPELIATLSPKQPETGVDAQTASARLDTGTRAQVVLLRSLSASKNRPGDSFPGASGGTCALGIEDCVAGGRSPAGTVLKATPPRWLSRPGMMTLAFTGLAMLEGGSGAISATVAGAEVDSRSRTRLDSEGGLSGGRPGKAWMLINLGTTAGIAKVSDDGTQLLIEALVSTATDASTAGVARIVAACTSGIFMVTRHGRDVVLPRFTEMDITFDRPFLLPQPTTPSNTPPKLRTAGTGKAPSY